MQWDSSLYHLFVCHLNEIVYALHCIGLFAIQLSVSYITLHDFWFPSSIFLLSVSLKAVIAFETAKSKLIDCQVSAQKCRHNMLLY